MSATAPSTPFATPSPVPDGLRRLARNAVVPMVARLVDLAFALVYLRFLQQEGAGAYAFLVAFTTYLDTLVDFGLNALLARDVSRAPGLARVAFRGVNVVRLGLWVVGLPLVAVVFGPARGLANLPDDVALAGWLFYLALLPTVLAKTATGLLWALERLEVPALVAVLASTLKAVLGSAALVTGLGLVGLAGTSLAINLVTATILLLVLSRAWGNAAAGPRDASVGAEAFGSAALLRESWPLFVNQLLQGLFFKVDSLLLPRLAGLAPAGAYSAAYKVAEGAGVVSSSFTLAIFPRLSREAGGPEGLSRAYRLSLRVLLQVALPLAAGTMLLAEPIVALVGGRGFLPDSAIALSLLIWYLPFSYVNGLTQYVLIALGRQRFLTGAFVAALVFNVAANLLLIPRYGYVAAAWVTVGSELVLLAPFWWAASQAVPGVSLVRPLWQPLIASAVMAVPVWWLRDTNVLLAILAGVLVYPAALWLLGGVDAEERGLLCALVKRG